MSGPPLRDAATVILARAHAGRGEIFLIQRHQESGFFGGAYAFPGGRLDEADCALAQRWPRPPCAAAMQATPGRTLSTAEAGGLCVAACRELFEEVAVLLARRADGSRWQAPVGDALPALRRRLNQGALRFADVLDDLGVVPDFAALGYWAHWITPSVESRRYDTRFFVARMPPDQTAAIDQHETVAQRWDTPAAIVAAFAQGEIVLPPPTFRIVEEMHELAAPAVDGGGGVDLSQLAARPVWPIQPKLLALPDGMAILLPWDPAYAAAPGDPLPGDLAFPAKLRAGVSRVVLRDGRWRSETGGA